MQHPLIRLEGTGGDKTLLQSRKLVPALDRDSKIDVACGAAWPQTMDVNKNEVPRRGTATK